MYRNGQNHKNLYQNVLLDTEKIIGFIFRETRKGLYYSGKLYHTYIFNQIPLLTFLNVYKKDLE